MSNLASIFGSLNRYVILEAGMELSTVAPGVVWYWAANGIFKRGVDAHQDIMICVAETPRITGLEPLKPQILWFGKPATLPGRLLQATLVHARRLATRRRPIEQQYHITNEMGMLRVRVPPQQASAVRVHYQLPNAPVLLDLHSHHQMPAYFSTIDNCDDQGLGVTAVLGRVCDEHPELMIRVNVYGHRVPVYADTLINDLGNIHCATRRLHAGSQY